MDVLAIDMIEPLREGGPLDLISGLDLASGPLTVNPSNADYNLDGKVDGDEIYRDGVKTFYQRIREVLGPDRVLTTSLDYEFVSEGFINGVNQEGLAQPDDPWEVRSPLQLLFLYLFMHLNFDCINLQVLLGV